MGYLAHKKSHSPRTLRQAYAYSRSMRVVFSYERGTPVKNLQDLLGEVSPFATSPLAEVLGSERFCNAF